MTVAKDLRSDTVTDDAHDADLSSHHCPGHGSEFDADFLSSGDGM